MTPRRVAFILCAVALAASASSAVGAQPPAYRIVAATVASDYTYSGAVGDTDPVAASGSETARLTQVRPSAPDRNGMWELHLRGPVTGTFDRAVATGPAHCSTSFDAAAADVTLGVNLVGRGRRTLVQFGMSPGAALGTVAQRLKGECVGSGPLLVCGCPADEGLAAAVSFLPADHKSDSACDGVAHWCISVPTARTRSRRWTATIVRTLSVPNNSSMWGSNSGTETYTWKMRVTLQRVGR
jgi:hypothetical protein